MVDKQENQYQPTKSQIFGDFKSFRLLITASSGSGKSVLVKNLLTNPSFGISDRFQPDSVFVLNPTLKIDNSYSDIKKYLTKRSNKEHQFSENEQFFSKDLEQQLSTVYDLIKEKAMGKKDNNQEPEPTLIVLDDCLLEISFGQQSQLSKMLVKMRHYGVSCIVVSQYLKSLHPLSRAQFTHYITFSTSNKKEVEKIRDECASTIKNQQFYEIYHFCVDQPYSYMLVILGWPIKWKFFKGKGTDLQQLQI